MSTSTASLRPAARPVKALLARAIDGTVKQRRLGAFALYTVARRIVRAFENHDVDMTTNGERWLQGRLAARGPVDAMDVGANRGEWVEGLLAHRTARRVVCYEPVPATFRALAARTNDPRAILVEAALSASPGSLRLNAVLDNPSISSVYDIACYQDGHPIEPIEVPATTGDREMARLGLSHLTILKIDAEGHDLAVASGFAGALGRGAIDLVQFEVNQFTLAAHQSLRAFFQLFGEAYLVCRLLPRGLEACGYHPMLDSFSQSNWVAVRRAYLDAAAVRDLGLRAAGGEPGRALARALAGNRLATLLGLEQGAPA
ncbi:FkbM family methyltransferase [Acuticoccus mangrovi]|uniref:FkbM family methyltransferase n=1 Tax=Acuticoccus mangrovi TaxID=2796142 RepID=A0A934INX1_9HYPH|nr:FkbM family methyltransferase [Acuticoccus mangrovi]MBJ3775926.1 FkbM family methyltransferase [Acuticoccus mangrovi]